MTEWFDEYPDWELCLVPRAEVVRCCREIDIVAVVEEALRAHAEGHTLLPDEAYLGWRTPSGATARSLAMPAALAPFASSAAVGVKVINGSLANPGRGIARSQGLVLLFDPERAWPCVAMEAAFISAMRTAAVTAIATRHLGPAVTRRVAVIGCGTLARAHLALLPTAVPTVDRVVLYDLDPGRAARLARTAEAAWRDEARFATVAPDVRTCVAEADLVVTVTTATEGYLRHDWLRSGTLISHVSLDDVLPEVVERADLLVVDDWQLVSTDARRLLGRLYHEGRLRAADGSANCERRATEGVRAVDTTVGDVLVGRHPGRARPTDIVLFNPFGMALLDVAVADRVWTLVRERGLGRPILM